MQLYEVRIETTTYVMAKNDSNAVKIAENHIGEDIQQGGVDDIHVQKIGLKDIFTIPKDWLESIPYGSKDDKIIRDILENMKLEK